MYLQFNKLSFWYFIILKNFFLDFLKLIKKPLAKILPLIINKFFGS